MEALYIFAGLCCKNLRGTPGTLNLTFLFCLDSHSEQTGNIYCLLSAISFFNATYLTFPEHIHRFIPPAGVHYADSNEMKPIPSLTNRLMKR